MVKLCGTATADSEQNSSRGYHPAIHGNDGDMTTRWTAADVGLEHYWTLDMGCEQSPERVVIYWEYPNGNFSDPYGAVFQVSQDGQVFTDLFYVEQAGQVLSVDMLTSAEGSGVDAGGGGAGGASGGAGGGTMGGAGDGGTGGSDAGGTQTPPWDGKARYIRVQITKLPPLVNGRASWASFFELEVYAHYRNDCGVGCP